MLNVDDLLIDDLHSDRGMVVGGEDLIISHIAQYVEKRLNLKNVTLSLNYTSLYENNYIFLFCINFEYWTKEALLVMYSSHVDTIFIVFLIVYHDF